MPQNTVNTNQDITCLILIISIVIIIIVGCKAISKERINVVRRVSTCFEQAKEINEVFHFYDIDKVLCLEKKCNSKTQYDRFDAHDYLVGIALEQRETLEDFVFKAEYNRTQYDTYIDKMNEIPPTPKEIIKKRGKIGVQDFHDIEDSLCKEILFKPRINPIVKVKVSYVSQKGRNTYSREEKFSVEQIKDILLEASKRLSYEDSKQYQRSLMTASLRYQILHRDHFRCTICGASVADGAKLEVDHIKPISKGGKTEPNNLRTLCQSCNRGKRDRYDPQGVN